ncbi:helix-turn-helix domain-containing protein [Escherichia coli]|uniref:helix-turn-helix domain-containing protein n=1 Tax=Escherichia coli TaxID=562 RepID=UPI0007E8F108|nr:helix-turn-helix domain-containing protein [Escherichia coli]EEW3194492.1 helix-turn-helix domain-containing protein [Escherichia coli]EFO0451529.1 helix-turn-helix domain-containing protein [Escherichia coli]EIU0510409.1 helix-turn-helix domain-containing protein [Escherichia coli]EKO9769668.1 helix-turn-helix domain-containing protein [Escherichia coli]MCT6294659.1 helix-turn-helix domain-containing protein [Escherichia coli]
MINKATTLDCLEELKNLGSLITLIAKATPDATLSGDIESCAGLAWDMTNSISRKLSSAMLLQNKNSAINNRLRTQRESCGLTTAELARLLDLDEEIIIQWESGEYEPTISMLIPLANVLGCDPLSLLSEKNSAAAVTVNQPDIQEESIGTRIEAARKKVGLTEADLARMIHTYNDPINDWECGICEVPASQIIPLANALGCDPMWLLTGGPIARASSDTMGQ